MYDPYDKKNDWSKCYRGYTLNPDTRWCCKECWIDQRKQYNYKFDPDIFNEEFNEEDFNKENFKNKYWDILLLTPPKTKYEIRKQYHKLSLLYHPDKGGDNDKFIEVKDAYDNII